MEAGDRETLIPRMKQSVLRIHKPKQGTTYPSHRRPNPNPHRHVGPTGIRLVVKRSAFPVLSHLPPSHFLPIATTPLSFLLPLFAPTTPFSRAFPRARVPAPTPARMPAASGVSAERR
jgi:hypothetical protein